MMRTNKILGRKITAFTLAMAMTVTLFGSMVSAEELLPVEPVELVVEDMETGAYVDIDDTLGITIDSEAEIEVIDETDSEMTDDANFETDDLEGMAVEGLVDDGAAVFEAGEASLEGEGGILYPEVGPEDSVRANCVKVGIKGTYTTESATKILNKLNAIRKEACDNGYKNPVTGAKLTSTDYVPMKWSSDMEAIARLRAMEASILNAHDRPNGDDCFTAEEDLGAAYSSGESLAWNWESAGLMQGINQWYSEKDAYNGKASGQTGHYKMIIDPRNVYVGVACCKAEGSKWESTVAMRTTRGGEALDETKDSTTGKQTVAVEVKNTYIKKLNVTGLNSLMAPGASGKFTAGVSLSVPDYYGESRSYSGTLMEATITSSNPAVLWVDAEGNYAVADIAPGSKEVITVTVSAGTKSETKTVTVCAPDMELMDTTFSYRGVKLQPAVRAFTGDSNLRLGTDYTVVYGDDTHDNITAGDNGIVAVVGKGNYAGLSLSRTFTIDKASAVIRPLDCEMGYRESIPVFCFDGNLQGKDKLVVSSESATCNPEKDGENYKLGKYMIVPVSSKIGIVNEKGEDVSASYNLSYENGELTVTKGAGWHEITYVMNGHGSAPSQDKYLTIEHAGLIPAYIPSATGFTFDGWYTDMALTKQWNYDSDTVQTDLTLYAKWSDNCINDLYVSIAPNYIYTGSAIKPNVTVRNYVFAYGINQTLALKKDYTLRYVNNTNVNTTPVSGRGMGEDFDESLPYVVVTGVGNYSGELKINFNILPASIGDGENPAAGIAMKYYPNLKTSAKDQDVFASMKRGKLGLVQNRDIQVSLKTLTAYDEEGTSVPADTVLENHLVPAGYSGTFELTITGLGNNSGSIVRTVRVDDPSRQMSAASVSIGKSSRKKAYTGSPITLPASDITVKLGKKTLSYGTDYTVSYINNVPVGNATVRITGVGAYDGYKDAAFQITGTALTDKTLNVVDFPKEREYTGRPQLVTDLDVYYTSGNVNEKLRYGWDYLISYTGNVNAGKVTVTYTGLGKGGYTGTVKKTFKITPIDISDVNKVTYNWEGAYVVYNKKGARTDSFTLFKMDNWEKLVKGRDYTLEYKSIFKVGTETASVTIKGKGNYCGAILQKYNIHPRTFTSVGSGVEITVKPMAYDARKAPSAQYKPAVTVMVDGSYLKKTEYEVRYYNNTQEAITQHMSSVYSPGPYLEVIGKGPYADPGMTYGVSVAMCVYKPETKLTAKNTYAVVEDAYYTGMQVCPKVRLYYIDAALAGTALNDIRNSLQGLTDHDAILAAGQGCVKQIAVNYPNTFTGNPVNITYGTNITAGKGKGTLTVTPVSCDYGGPITYKFDILKKEMDSRRAE